MHMQVGTKMTALVGVGLLTLSVGFLLAGQGSSEANKGGANVSDAVQDIAAAIKGGKNAEAKKQVELLGKKINDVEAVMGVFKLRTKKGLGVGKAPGKIVPDGIELKLVALGREPLAPANLAAEADALEEMAYVIAAVAEVAGTKPPAKFEGKQTKKDWLTWAQDTRVGADEFAKAVKGKEAQEIKTAAKKLNTVCSTCHEMFK